MTEEIKTEVEISLAPADLTPEAVEPKCPVGDILRAAREAAGLTQDDIANRFKVRVAQVDAVETCAWEKLPGRTFARGLVRGYARELRLEAEPLVALVMPEINVVETPIVPPSTPTIQPSQTMERPRKDLGMVVLGVLLLVMSVLAYFLWPAGNPKNEAPLMPPPSTEAPAPVQQADAQSTLKLADGSVQQLSPNIVPLTAPAESAPAAQVPAATFPGIKLTFTGTSWVEVKDKTGNVVFSQTGSAGLEKEVSGQSPFAIHIGNASGVKLQYKGQAVDLQPFTSNNVSRVKLD